MKIILLLGLTTYIALANTFNYYNILNSAERSIENGGIKSAIDAYKDGVGAELVDRPGSATDNTAMNTLTIKYGEEAKISNKLIPDFVNNLPQASQSDLTLVAAMSNNINGSPCNDANPLTYNDIYTNGACVGSAIPPAINTCAGGFNDSYASMIDCRTGLITTSSLSSSWLNLTTVNGNLYLHNNPNLSNIDYLSNLKDVKGNIILYWNNVNLDNLSSLNNLINSDLPAYFDNRNYTIKMNNNSYLCINYATKIIFRNSLINGGAYFPATALTKSQVCNP